MQENQDNYQIQTPPDLEGEREEKKSHKTMKIILSILLVLILLLVGGSTFAYFRYVRGPLILKNASEQMRDLKSFSFTSQIKLNVKMRENDEVLASEETGMKKLGPVALPKAQIFEILNNIVFNLDGKVDLRDEENKKISLNLNLDVPESLGFSWLPQMSFLFLGQDRYLKLTELPVVPLFDLSFFAGQWIGLNLAEFAGVASEATVGLVDVEQLVGERINSEKIDFWVTLAGELNNEEENEQVDLLLRKIILARPFAIKIEGSDKIGLEDTKKLSVSLSKEGIKKSLPYLEELVLLAGEDAITEEERQKFLERVDGLDESKPVAYVWIGGGNYVYRIYFDIALDNQMFGESGSYDLSLQYDIFFAEHDQDQGIVAPSDVKSVAQIYQEMMSGSIMEDTMPSEPDYLMEESSGEESVSVDDNSEYLILLEKYTNPANSPADMKTRASLYPSLPKGMTEQDQDMDTLPDGVEWVLGTDIFVADSDGDGYEDWQEILNGYNPDGSGVMSDEMKEVVESVVGSL